MRADALFGVADLDGHLDGCVEHLAAVRQRLARGAPYVKLSGRAADVDRDRLEREPRFARGFGGVGLSGFGGLDGVLGRGGGGELRLRVGTGGVELLPQLL